MRRVLTVALFIVLANVAASGQEANDRRGYGYVFGGQLSGSGRTTPVGGGGGEVRLYKGLGVGAEAAGGDSFGMFSVNGSYHFIKPGSGQKLVPFVTGGYTLLGPSDSTNLVNYGAGVNYWVADRVGLRFEVRDHKFLEGSNHILGIRVGVTFR